MHILLFAFVVIIVLALVIWAIDRMPLGDSRLKWLLEVIAVLAAAFVIGQRAGLW